MNTDKRKIVISGMGVISAIGRGCKETTALLLNEKSGIASISVLNTVHRDFPAGEIKLDDRQLKELAGIKPAETHSRNTLIGIIALDEALRQAKIDKALLRKIPFISGTTVGGMDLCENSIREILKDECDKETAALFDCGSCTDDIARHFGSFAYTETISTACSSALNAIIEAAELIEAGEAEIVAAGGCECLTKFHLNGFNSLMIIDKEVCKPFDADRHGLNLGEAAAYLIIESEESARRRGAKALAVISGWDNCCDAYHQTASSPDGSGAARAMLNALNLAGLQASDISYINTHGTGTDNNDASEMAAMKSVFKDGIPPFSSTKAFTGHATSAAGSLEAILCILAINGGFIPANLNWKTPMPEGEMPVTKTIANVNLEHVVCNSFGFGGNDSCIIISKYS